MRKRNLKRVKVNKFPEPGEQLESILSQLEPDWAEMLRSLHAVAQRNENDPVFLARYEAREAEKLEEKRQSYLKTVHACLAGKWGEAHQDLARDLMQDRYSGAVRDDIKSLEFFMGESVKTQRVVK